MGNHAYRVEPRQQDLGDARPPGVKVLHRLTPDADDELGKRGPEGNAVAQNTLCRLSDSFLGQGNDHRIGPLFHKGRPYRPSGAREKEAPLPGWPAIDAGSTTLPAPAKMAG